MIVPDSRWKLKNIPFPRRFEDFIRPQKNQTICQRTWLFTLCCIKVMESWVEEKSVKLYVTVCTVTIDYYRLQFLEIYLYEF